LKESLDIPKKSWIRKNNLVVDDSYTSCGSGSTAIYRKATEVDRAVLLLETELKTREQLEKEEQERATYDRLKAKYEKM
jgi:hypothetical protein